MKLCKRIPNERARRAQAERKLEYLDGTVAALKGIWTLIRNPKSK